MRWSLVLVAGFTATLPRVADACTVIGNCSTCEVAPAPEDRVPPDAPVIAAVGIARVLDERDYPRKTCGHLGRIEVRVTARDDVASAADLRYQLRLASGALPSGLRLPAGPVLPGQPDALVFDFDGAAGDFAFALEIRAVDRNGNVGPPTAVEIRDSTEGCTTTSGAGLALAFAARLPRRRRRA